MKLNLGCRDRAIPGWKGMDCDRHSGVDFVGDVAQLSEFKDGEVSEIYASHILEHFPHPKTMAVLGEWFRVLAPGGKLFLAVPDFEKVCGIYRTTGMTGWIRNYLWGDQQYNTAFHYCGFDEASLSQMLKDVGFSQVFRAEHFGINPRPDCSDLTVLAKDPAGNPVGLLVSLNLVGVK